MSSITIDFTKRVGKIKPMNAGNNGPKAPRGDQTSGNFDTFRMLHIPYARLHDANHCYAYGAPWTIDVRAIFQDWDADADDPASYDFQMTDVYLRSLAKAGTEPFFRLGGSIEHNPKKHFTCVPPDFQKFAEVCEHIVRHCTGDWANGLGMKITYWEIWNEPELDRDASDNKRCWQGTQAEFRELFRTTFTHLKKRFPHLKVGGPSACSPINNGNDNWCDNFFGDLHAHGIEIDFYSWHRYTTSPHSLVEAAREVRKYMDEHGQAKAESILNEWNYVKGWSDAWVYSLEQEAGMKGAALALCAMLALQKEPLDLLMYYDMRVSCGMNGLWHPVTFDRFKTWYSYFMFDKLAQLKNEVESASNDADVYALGATDDAGRRRAAVVGFYNDDDNFSVKKPEIRLIGLTDDQKANLVVRMLDDKHDLVDVPFELEGDVVKFNFNIQHNAGLLLQA